MFLQIKRSSSHKNVCSQLLVALTELAVYKCIVQERLLDHDCEYTRQVHPSSSFMQASPSDIFSADILPKMYEMTDVSQCSHEIIYYKICNAGEVVRP